MSGRLRDRLLACGERPVLIDETGATRSGRELIDRVDRLAGALARNGLTGERIGVWFTNSLAAFEAYLAVEWLGATRVVLDPHAAPAEAANILAAAGTEAVLADAEHAPKSAGLVLCHDDQAPLQGSRRMPADNVPDVRPLHLYPRAVRGGELFAVPISYGNWAATIRLNCELYRSGRYGRWAGASEVMLTVQQLLHGTGLMGSFPFLHMGLPQVVARTFEPARVAELIDRYHVTSSGMTSGMLTKLLDAIPPHGLPSLQRLLYGGAALDLGQLLRAIDLLGGVLIQVYGRLEGGWPLTILSQEDHIAIARQPGDERNSSCGRTVGGEVEIRLRSNGELRTRSPMAVAEHCDPDGWCGLGDLAHIDSRGYVYLRGRTDTMVNTGYHVYPEEIEEALHELPGVADARVVGQPGGRGGEVLWAYVLAEPGSDLNAANMTAALSARLAAYKVPKVIKFVDALDVIE